MKIYCTENKRPLDKFIGKDVWIRVKIHERNYAGRWYSYWDKPYMIRVLEYDPEEDWYVINKIIDTFGSGRDGQYKGNRTQKQKACENKHYIKRASIKLVEPVEILTTPEIFGED